MKKVFKIIVIILIIIAVLVIVGMKILNTIPTPETDYWKKIETGGEIETDYLQEGNYPTAYYEEAATQSFEKYEIWYPSELTDTDKKYPVIIVCNGTGWKASRSKHIYEHYASWGFIVVGNEEQYSWNAFCAETTIRHLERLNENAIINGKGNIFYQKVDFKNIGIIGHSQGGVGVINAITDTDHKDIYKTAIALSPTNKELAAALEWPYDASKIEIPVMLISGAGGGDDWVVTQEGLTDIYNDINSPKVMMRRADTAHGDTQFHEDGYVIAWFMWQLQEDEEAEKAFTGDSPEILTNELYQDQKIGIEE